MRVFTENARVFLNKNIVCYLCCKWIFPVVYAVFSFFPSCSTKSVCLDCCLYVNKRVISMSFNPPDVVCSLSSFVTSKHSKKTIFSSSDMHGFFSKLGLVISELAVVTHRNFVGRHH